MSLISRVKRREMLGFIGSAAMVSLLGCQRERLTNAIPTADSSDRSVADSAQTAQTAQTTEYTAMDLPGCVVSPQQTEGPYFVEEGLNRSDIRFEPSDGSVKDGIPLRLILQVFQVGAGSCTPLEGAVVDIWHCDSQGIYSGVRDRNFTTVGQQFLRGSQITHSDGTVEFITIYPGWYPGRAVHMHFKVRNRIDPQGYEFTSQLYFNDALSDQIYTQSPYRDRGQRDVRNERDRIYQASGDQLTLQLTPEKAGYTGRFDIGLRLS